jgi:hypothetical protein
MDLLSDHRYQCNLTIASAKETCAEARKKIESSLETITHTQALTRLARRDRTAPPPADEADGVTPRL